MGNVDQLDVRSFEKGCGLRALVARSSLMCSVMNLQRSSVMSSLTNSGMSTMKVVVERRWFVMLAHHVVEGLVVA